MKNVLIIIKKQLKDTIKNKTILIQFTLFPIMTLIMKNAIKMEEIPELFFTKLFSIMYIGMAPLIAVATIISEEKEKNTLRVLMMSNVAPWQYLMGVGIYVWSVCMIGSTVMAMDFEAKNILLYLMIMGTGFAISIVLGGCIGIFAKNQMMATSLAMPTMAVLSFGSMLARFNSRIEKAVRFLYTQQLSVFLENMDFNQGMEESAIIVMINAVVFTVMFFIIFKRKGLE